MDDAGALDAADPGKAVATMSDQRLNESAFGMARRGMDDEACGLVQDEEMIVLEDDVERDVFAAQSRGLGFGNGDDNVVAGADFAGRIAGDRAIQRDLARFDERLPPRA